MDQPQRKNPPQINEQPSTHRRADLKAYLDGEISSLHRWWVGRHLDQCASCREEITVLKRLSKEMHDLDSAVPRPQLRARILASLPDASPDELAIARNRTGIYGVRRGDWSVRKPALALSGACTVLLLMGGAFAMSRWHPADVGLNQTVAITPTPRHRRMAALAATPMPDPAIVIPPITTEPEKYTDPTSLEAERLAALTLPTKLLEKRLASEAASGRQANTDTVPKRAGTKSNSIVPKAEPTQIALAVVDVNTARQQIQTWATAAGATVTVVTGKKLAEAIRVNGTMLATGQSADVTSSQLPPAQKTTLLQLRVPAQQADNLKSTLSQMGTRLAFRTNVKGTPYIMSPMQTLEPRRVDDMVPAIAAKAPLNAANATVTVYLRLQANASK